MKSTTLRAAYHIAGLGVTLVVGLLILEGLGARPATIEAFVALAEVIMWCAAAGQGVSGARHFPTANRAPTSAEMAARPQDGQPGRVEAAATIMPSEP